MRDSPFDLIDWAELAQIEHRGETGSANERSVSLGELRLRLVEYSPGYTPDHWCERGHILFVLRGEVTIRFADGRDHRLDAGMACRIKSSADVPHQAISLTGASLFIVD